MGRPLCTSISSHCNFPPEQTRNMGLRARRSQDDTPSHKYADTQIKRSSEDLCDNVTQRDGLFWDLSLVLNHGEGKEGPRLLKCQQAAANTPQTSPAQIDGPRFQRRTTAKFGPVRARGAIKHIRPVWRRFRLRPSEPGDGGDGKQSSYLGLAVTKSIRALPVLYSEPFSMVF
ncbi:unnamed protein product [Leuciscus chuanchicus]